MIIRLIEFTCESHMFTMHTHFCITKHHAMMFYYASSTNSCSSRMETAKEGLKIDNTEIRELLGTAEVKLVIINLTNGFGREYGTKRQKGGHLHQFTVYRKKHTYFCSERAVN